MTQEAKFKKNPDFTASAVNLKNAPEVEKLLSELRVTQVRENDVMTKINEAIPVDLRLVLIGLQNNKKRLISEIEVAINLYGSYQDVPTGAYALKQRKVSLSYDPKLFRTKHPEFAPAVVIETVDTKKIDGLIKGGLLDKSALITEGVATESESFAYIIK